MLFCPLCLLNSYTWLLTATPRLLYTWKTLEQALESPLYSCTIRLHGSFQDVKRGDYMASVNLQKAKSLFDELDVAR